MTFGVFGILLALAVNTVAIAAALVRVRWTRQRRGYGEGNLPGVTVLKPLCGHDDELESNLESFARSSYPKLQLILAVARDDDPALPIAERVAQRHPERDITVVVDGRQPGWNFKVNQLEAMFRYARHDLLLISDSNVRNCDRALAAMATELDSDPQAGMVYQPLVGVGERTAAAALENLRLTDYCGVMCVALKTLLGIDAVTGKSVLLRRAALEEVGFGPLRNVAGDDQVLRIEMRKRGWKVLLHAAPAECVHVRWSLRELISRHVRHAGIRLRLSAWSYPLEAVGSPVVLATAAWVLGMKGGGAWWIGAAVSKTVLDAAACWVMRGNLPRLRYLVLVPFRELLMLGIWCVPLFSSRVSWRGTELRMSRRSQLLGINPPRTTSTQQGAPRAVPAGSTARGPASTRPQRQVAPAPPEGGPGTR